jgi:hypothetical protein
LITQSFSSILRRYLRVNYRVFFRGVTWQRESHGLFDYESRNIAKVNLKASGEGQILLVNNEIEFVESSRVEDLIRLSRDVTN